MELIAADVAFLCARTLCDLPFLRSTCRVVTVAVASRLLTFYVKRPSAPRSPES